MFVPLSIHLGAGGESRPLYNRSFELTARQFEAFSRASADMTVPLTRIGEDLHTQVSMAFASEGATGATGKWKQLSPTYASWKQQHAPGVPTLVGLRPTGPKTVGKRAKRQTYAVSGRMMRELLTPLSDRATWHITPKRLLYAPLSNIAGYQQTGTGNMPARPPVDPTLTFLHSVDRTFTRWVGALTDALGL